MSTCLIEVNRNRINLFPRLNFADQLFISSLNSSSFDEKKYFSRIHMGSLGFVFNIAKHSPTFLAMCHKDEYIPLWQELYSQYNLLLQAQRDIKTVAGVYLHKNTRVSSFQMLQGAYYYDLANQISEAEGSSYSLREVYCLEKAIEFGSIHATQSYLRSLYQKVDKNGSTNPEESEKLLLEATALCKAQQGRYGSYAYMMLAEACLRYSIWGQISHNTNRQQSAIKLALDSCDKAAKYLEASQFSIHNASLGKGLAASNSFNIATPEEAKELIKNWVDDNPKSEVSSSHFRPS